jgi:hypothetical protein
LRYYPQVAPSPLPLHLLLLFSNHFSQFMSWSEAQIVDLIAIFSRGLIRGRYFCYFFGNFWKFQIFQCKFD